MAITDVPVDSGSTSTGGATSLTPALAGTATAGNLLVCGASVDAGVTAFVTPSGWTAADNYEGAAIAGANFYKVSDGTETNAAISWGNSRAASAWILEFDSTDIDTGTAPLLAEDESNVSTVVTTQSSGTTSATTVADALAIATYSSDAMATVFVGRSYTTDYTERMQVGSSSSTRPGSMVATSVRSSTGAQSCTFTTTDTGDEMYGQILVFQGSGAGGGFQPVWAYNAGNNIGFM